MTKKVVLAITLVFIAALVVFAIHRDKVSAVTFFTVPIERGPLRNTVNATGAVQTVETVQVGIQVSGQLALSRPRKAVTNEVVSCNF